MATSWSVDDAGVRFTLDDGPGDDFVVDVCFDGRRIWSFWLQRDAKVTGAGSLAEWPAQLKKYLNGITQLTIVAHVTDETLYADEVALGTGEGRIAVVNNDGKPLGIDKSNRIAQTFDTRSAEQVAPLLDSIEEVLAAIKVAGIDAFPAYGTLLGAVRGGKLIGHDSDADLGYVSKHTHPADVILESFALQRKLVERGYRIVRYSGAAFKVDVIESDGSVRGLDVFGGFARDGKLYLMGEIGTDFDVEWIFPLGETTLEGRTLPAPAVPEKLLEATYGPNWKVPDPAFHFETPTSTTRRLNGWFRGTRVFRSDWDRRYSTLRLKMPSINPSSLAEFVVEREGAPVQLVDLGAGRASDAMWFARQGVAVTALDYIPGACRAVQLAAEREGVALEARFCNVNELRSWLSEATRLAHQPGPRTIVARHLIDATNAAGRDAVWRFASMTLREGGRLYLEFLTGPPGARRGKDFLTPLPIEGIETELAAHGAVIRHREEFADEKGRTVARLVVEWN